jgi:hypothetical protein
MDTKKISNQNLLKNILSEHLKKFPTKIFIKKCPRKISSQISIKK